MAVSSTITLLTTILTLQIYYVWIVKSVYFTRRLQLYGWLLVLICAFSWIVFSGIVISSVSVVGFEVNSCVVMHVFLFVLLLAQFFNTFNYNLLSIVAHISLLIITIWMMWPNF